MKLKEENIILLFLLIDLFLFLYIWLNKHENKNTICGIEIVQIEMLILSFVFCLQLYTILKPNALKYIFFDSYIQSLSKFKL